MKITHLRIRNFRTLESIDLDFQSSYTAICGPNDCGKTNVVRVIWSLVQADSVFRVFEEDEEISIADDFPKWSDAKGSHREINIELIFSAHRERDAGLFQFLTKQLSINTELQSLEMSLTLTYRASAPEPTVVVICDGKRHDGIDAQQVLKQLQSSRTVFFHNSTQIDIPSPFRAAHRGGFIRADSPEHVALVASMRSTVNRGLARISKSQQRELEDLLGRLEAKYKVGLSMPTFDFASVPFNVTLGERKFEVPLDDWGSGTQNRTLILLTLFRAKQLGDAAPSASKLTPVIVVEEPESFLHPAAQAEFGRVLQDLAEEFEVQVIVTTHSPYLLNLKDPSSNLLLSRHMVYKQLRGTSRIDTGGENWMKPFGLALGMEFEEFKPWKGLILSGSDAVLLVEGDTDKEYFEMLRDDTHGSHKLDFQGEIISYEGTGNLQNLVLLRFIKNRYKKLFVTYDLDADKYLEKPLTTLGLQDKKHYMPVGVEASGKRNIEGLLPDSVRSAVYGGHADLVSQATQGTKDEQESAKNRLKKLFLEEFKNKATPGPEFFGGFYPIVRAINAALK